MQEASGCLRGYRLCGPSLVYWFSYSPRSRYKEDYSYCVFCNSATVMATKEQEGEHESRSSFLVPVCGGYA